jgi:Zn-dependent peptidase ImmA (M78 family)/DNA-binding XRE family transcriptional regulator
VTTAGFNPNRLTLFRERGGLTKDQLASACGVSRRTVRDWEAGQVASPPLDVIAAVLGVEPWLLGRPNSPALDVSGVSFRSLSTLGARQTKRVLAAARLVLELNAWLDEVFRMPAVELPSKEELTGTASCRRSPEELAGALRRVWNLGDRPVRNLLGLLERRGIRIFSLPDGDRNVDAFSFWHANRPFIFVNPDRSAERIRFDLAHEVGHLIAHRGITTAREKQFEREADQFASSFLMPAEGIRAQAATGIGELRLPDVFTMKHSWRVAAVAMARRLFDLGLIRDWHYRTWMVELSSRGYRRSEPDGIHPEQSKLITSLLTEARAEGIGLTQMAQSSKVPLRTIEESFFGLAVVPLRGGVVSRCRDHDRLLGT